jgi:hypothetical protein
MNSNPDPRFRLLVELGNKLFVMAFGKVSS